MQNGDKAFPSISQVSCGQMLVTLEQHGIPVFSLNCAYLYILRLSLVYQIKLNINKQQEKCRSKQSYLFHKSQRKHLRTLQNHINFQRVKKNSISSYAFVLILCMFTMYVCCISFVFIE